MAFSDKNSFLSYLENNFQNGSIKRMEASTPRITRIKFIREDGATLLVDLCLASNYLGIDSIHAGQKNTGIGKEVIEIFKKFCEENQVGLFAEDVQNIDFFGKQGFEPSIDDPENPYGYRTQWFWRG